MSQNNKMFEEIRISNYRLLKQITLSDFSQFNLIVGKNNCGKTSILEALFQSINPGNAGLLANTNDWRGLDILNPETWKSLFYKFNVHQEIEIVTKLKSPSEKRTLCIKPKTMKEGVNSESVVMDAENGGIIDVKDSSSMIDLLIIGLEYTFDVLPEGENPYQGSIQNKYLTQEEIQNQLLVKRRIEAFRREDPDNYKTTTSGRFLSPETVGLNLPKKFGEIAKKKEKSKIIEILNKVEINIHGLELIDGKLYMDLGFEELVPFNIMGSGIRKILYLVLDIMSMPNGILLIDEIENGLHYSILEILWDSVFETAKQYNVQIFATTHSYECVEQFHQVYLKKFGEKEEEIRLYRIEREKEDNYKVIKYTQENLKTALKQEWEIR